MKRALKRMVGHSPWEYVFNDGIGGAQTAIYDLLGKAIGLPVCRLLSPNPKKRIMQAFWSLSYPPDLLATEAKHGGGPGIPRAQGEDPAWEDPVAQAQAIFAAVPPRLPRVGRHQSLLGFGGPHAVLREEAGRDPRLLRNRIAAAQHGAVPAAEGTGCRCAWPSTGVWSTPCWRRAKTCWTP